MTREWLKVTEPTLFKVKLLEQTAYNDEGDILNIKLVDEEGNIYYYDYIFNNHILISSRMIYFCTYKQII